MPLLPRHIVSNKQTWKDGPISCFTWTPQVSSVLLTTNTTGQTVLQSVKLQNWRDRIRRRQNATTAFKATFDNLRYQPGHIFLGKWCPASNRFGFYQYDGDLAIGHTSIWDKPTSPSTTIHSKTQNEALTRAIKDAKSKQTHFRGGNFLAELGDTIRGLRNPAKGFRDLLDTYRKNARRRVKRACGRRSLPTTQRDFSRLEKDAPDVARAAQRALSDTWLEHNFGWQPLLSDAVDAYHALRALSARLEYAEFRGYAENDDPPTYVHQFRSHDITRVHWTARTQFKYDCVVYGAVKMNVDEPPLGQATEEMGVRARDFLPAVWEAIPYSFLIDYFTNIGDIIEAVSFPLTGIAWGSITFRNHSIRSVERVAVDPDALGIEFPQDGSNKVFSFKPFFVEWDRKYVDRAVWNGSYIPSFRFEIPGPKNWKKYFNIAALARLRTL